MSPAVPKPATFAKSRQYLAWIRGQPCSACGQPANGVWDWIEAAHLDSRRYGDLGNAIPLHGFRCHREGPQSLHVLGREKFQRQWALDLKAEGLRLLREYERTL